jgi:hypothetical protein
MQMTTSEIIATARQFGSSHDAEGFGAFAEAHRMVVQNPNAKRNIGKVAMIDLLRAYAEGVRG